MYQTETNIRVRYAETDQMGYVYYGNYATYYEVARVENLRALGFQYKKLEEQGVMMPVRELQVRYVQPAKYDDLLCIKTFVKAMPSARMVFDYEIFNQENILLNTGQTTLVFVDMKTNKLLRCPEILKNLFEPYF